MSRKVAILVMTMACFGCASVSSQYRPAVDTTVSPGNYEQDLAECQRYAQGMVSPGTAAVVGAVLGLIVGTIANKATHYDGGAYRNVGAAFGAAGGANRAAEGMRETIKRCMQGRGYSVLY